MENRRLWYEPYVYRIFFTRQISVSFMKLTLNIFVSCGSLTNSVEEIGEIVVLSTTFKE